LSGTAKLMGKYLKAREKSDTGDWENVMNFTENIERQKCFQKSNSIKM
jgi:hypothetical protein